MILTKLVLTGPRLVFHLGPVSRHSRIETEVTLKDNRILTGYLFLETVDEKKNTFKYGFRPHRTQGDGTKWIYEGGIKDPTKVPKDINILKEGMWKLVRLTGPLKYRDKSIPALIKILMGFICWDVLSKKNEKNIPFLKSKFFNVIRGYAFLKKNPRGSFSWIDDTSIIQPPLKINHYSHFFSYSYKEGVFHGLGVLFGSVAYTLVLKNAPRFEGNFVFFELDGHDHNNSIEGLYHSKPAE